MYFKGGRHPAPSRNPGMFPTGAYRSPIYIIKVHYPFILFPAFWLEDFQEYTNLKIKQNLLQQGETAMKKRLLGLALALVMVISLLPLTAFAATPRPAFVFYDPNITATDNKIVQLVASGTTFYVTFEDVSDGSQVIGNKPVVVPQDAAAPTTNYIKFQFIDGVFYITFHEINCRPSASYGTTAFMRFYKNTSSFTNEYDIVLTLEGENTISGGTNARILFDNQGDVTITGSGSLNFSTVLSTNVMVQKKNSGNLLIQNTTLSIADTDNTDNSTACLAVNGQVTIDNSTVNISSDRSSSIVIGTSATALISGNTTTGVTIKNGSNVNLDVEKGYPAIKTNGPILIENSSAEISKSSGNLNPVMTSVPSVTGCTTVKYGETAAKAKDLDFSVLASGTTLATDHKFVYFKAVHECVAQADDGNCTTAAMCACGKEAVAAKTHIAGANADDCTKDTLCGNAGCTQVFATKLGDAHVKGEDDGDCTTPIMCTNTGCAQEAEAGAAKHTYTRTDCSVDSICSVCNKVAVPAGQHEGGEATCKAKAKCEHCGTEYGELGACKPAADDGNCTTAVKCSVCGKETTKAQTAHKYTDKADTTCDNAGCTNTRKVEGTENPKTGDNTALVLMVSLMATAAAAFVCTKKFAR